MACVLTMFEKYRLGLSSRKESVILSIRSSSVEFFQLVPPPCGTKPVPLVFEEFNVQLCMFVRFLTPCPECRDRGEARASLADCGRSIKTSSVRLWRRH